MIDTAPSEDPQASGSAQRGAARIVRRLLIIVVLALVLVAVVLAVPDLSGVRRDLTRIDPWWIVAGVVLELGSCGGFVLVFRAFFEEVSPRLGRRIAWIETASGALLPGGGVTSYMLGGVLLHREGMPRRQIVVRSGGVFWLTSAVNAAAVVLGAALLLARVGHGPHGFLIAALPALITVPVAVAVAASPWLIPRSAFGGRLSPLIDGIADAWRAGLHPSWRLIGALAYLGLDMAVLLVLLHGLGYDTDAGALILAYLVGYCAAIVPIPGAIGVLDGGLVGALVLYGVPAPKAAAAVLIYHAIAFWVPSLAGAGAYGALAHQNRGAKEIDDVTGNDGEAGDPPARDARCGGRTRRPAALRRDDRELPAGVVRDADRAAAGIDG